jgi:ribosomal-protein-alanine N-acetyltransferase
VARYRVFLRPPSAEDEREFLERMRASRSLHAPWVSMPSTPDAYAAYLERSRLETNAFYLAHRREDDAIVGFLNISEIVRGKFQSAFLGYGAVAEFAGRGYLTEAMELLLREAFTRLRLHRLEANIQPGNTASIALARRCGFELEGFSPRYLKIGGRWRDHERWAITKESWRRVAPARRGG